VKNHVFGAGAMVVAITCLLAAIIYTQIHFDFNSTPENMNLYSIPGLARDIYYYTISIGGVSAVAFILLFIAWILGIVSLGGIVVVIISAIGFIFGLASCIMCAVYSYKVASEGTNSEIAARRNNSAAQKYIKEALKDLYDYAYNTRCQDPDYKDNLKDVLPWDQIKFGDEATSNFQYVNFVKVQPPPAEGKTVQKVIHFTIGMNLITTDCGGSARVPIASNIYNYSKKYSYYFKNWWPLDEYTGGYYSVGIKDQKKLSTYTSEQNRWAIKPTTALTDITIISGKYHNDTDYSFDVFPVMYNKVSKELQENDGFRGDGNNYRFDESTKPEKSIGSFTVNFLKKQLDKKMSNAGKLFFKCTKEPNGYDEIMGITGSICIAPITIDGEIIKNSVDPYDGYFLFEQHGAKSLKDVYKSISSAPNTDENPPLKNKGKSMDMHDKIYSWLNSYTVYAQVGYSLCGIIAGGLVLLLVGIVMVFKDGGDETNGSYQKAA